MSVQISVVMASYNYGHFIEDAIRSVVSQEGFGNCELIVIDGGSKDETVDVLRRYSDKIAYWVSEPDKGQSDAFNKGFSHARGKFGCWLNADDLLLPGALKSVIRYMEQHPDCEWISGGVAYFNADKNVMWVRRGVQPFSRFWRYMPGWVVGGPSSFFSIARLRELSGFDIGLHYTMDIDLWKKFFRSGMHLHHIPRYFWGFRAHEASKTSYSLTASMNEKMRAETNLIMERYGYTHRQIRIGTLLLKVWGLISGSLIKSYMDSRYLKNRDISALIKLMEVA